jgi:large-conductance mechanosensitive channel
MNWKQPFELAFELALWSFGWLLVALIGFVVVAIFYAVVKTITDSMRKKSKAKEANNSLRVVKND